MSTQVEAMPAIGKAIVPSDADRRRLRACLLCGLIKSAEAFRAQGCDNCDAVLEMRGDSGKVGECTSARFEGMVALMEPGSAWVGRWTRCNKNVRGMYAVKVVGRLADDVVDDLQSQGIRYRARDGSAAV